MYDNMQTLLVGKKLKYNDIVVVFPHNISRHHKTGITYTVAVLGDA